MCASSEHVPAAELRGVTVRYGSLVALADVDLTVEPGSCTALLGPNGAGKTTAIRLLLGLGAPGRGTVRVFGGDPRTPATRRSLGTMLQVSKVPETLRVREHIETFRSYYPKPLPVARLLELAGLRGLEERLFGTLSGGERQRVLVALALAGDPRLLVLDEPTVGLDVAARRALRDVLHAARTDGRALLLTTHIMEEADALADRIVVLHRGRVIASGDPARIRRAIPGRRVSCVTSLELSWIRAQPGVQRAWRRAAAIEVLAAEPERLVAAMLAADAGLRELAVGAVPLEEAFLALTSGHAEEVAA